MDYNWQFHFHDYYFVMTFDDIEEITGDKSTLTDWLRTDVSGYHKTLDYIDDVINGKTSEDFLWGNAYKAYVKKDFTEIHFEMENVSPIKPCTIPTKLLREIVKAWLEEYKKFHNR